MSTKDTPRTKTAMALFLIPFVFLFALFVLFPLRWHVKYVTPIPPTTNLLKSVDVLPVDTCPQTFAFFADGRNGFNGFRDRSLWGHLKSAFTTLHSDDTDKMQHCYRFGYDGILLQSREENKSPIEKALEKRNPTTATDYAIISQIMVSANEMLDGHRLNGKGEIIPLNDDQFKVTTVVIVTDNFFGIGDMAYYSPYKTILNTLSEMCEKRYVAILSFPSAYSVNENETDVERSLYVMVVSSCNQELQRYCDDLLGSTGLSGATVVWNKPDLDSLRPSLKINESKQAGNYQQIYASGQKGFLLDRNINKRGDIAVPFSFSWSQAHGNSLFSFNRNDVNIVNWKIRYEIYPIDRHGIRIGKDPVFVSSDYNLGRLVLDIPLNVLRMLDGKESDRYFCEVTVFSPSIAAQEYVDLVNRMNNRFQNYSITGDPIWRQYPAIDSTFDTVIHKDGNDGFTYLSKAEFLGFADCKACNNRKTKLDCKCKDKSTCYTCMKDDENASSIVALCKRTRTLWLNRLVSYQNFVEPAMPAGSAKASFGFILIIEGFEG